ncbi:MAG: hypothetical protein QOJ86_4380 [Bradyrhizobium sp.]|jgi:hypothetical protein|nr:hypothetical protein [Bradyrhizobium sp.]
MTRAARFLGLALVALATSANAQKVEKTCQIVTTKSICKLECIAKSFSQNCDEPYNTCRSTCGLYDQQKTPAVADIFHGLVQRTNTGDPPFEKRLLLAEPAAKAILLDLQEQIWKGADSGVYVIVLFAPRNEGFKLQFVNRLKEDMPPADKGQLVLIFFLDPGTYSALKLKDPSIETMIQQAKDIVSKTVLR